MPMPLGHTAIGFATYETAKKQNARCSRVFLFGYIAVLANLPDVDVLFGLLAAGNGSAFHRGPTHSLLFAVAAGYLAAWLSRRWQRLPGLNAGLCTVLIFSHVLADLFLTSSPVSIFWPLEVNWTLGYNGWSDVVQMALFQSLQDFIIAAAVTVYLFILRQLRGNARVAGALFAFSKKRDN